MHRCVRCDDFCGCGETPENCIHDCEDYSDDDDDDYDPDDVGPDGSLVPLGDFI